MSLVSPAQIAQYNEEGYFILEGAMPPQLLTDLQDECQRFIELANADMDARGVTTDGINHRDKRYFIANRYEDSAKVTQFLFSDFMAELTHGVLGEKVFLFWEQYVVKCAEVGMKFAWHQDSGYVGFDHKPYLSCWCALDDMTEENGTVYLLPYSRAGTRDAVTHAQEAGSNDLVGYFGDDPGIPAIVPAGSVVCFSSTVFHCSGANITKRPRRVYLAQYATEPVINPANDEPKGLAVQVD
ncbi:MAG: phytanoyl-CoA dioxygenase family protein [Candidatus Hydrogenedentes bacterium]|nr:phytanoyl-CoA dioxygenase family protein [Candidatus Hydrogenedentota bacterium]